MASPERIKADKIISEEILNAGLFPGTNRGGTPAFKVTSATGAKLCNLHVVSWDIAETPHGAETLAKIRDAFNKSRTRNILALFDRDSIHDKLEDRDIEEIQRRVVAAIGIPVRAYFIGNPCVEEPHSRIAIRRFVATLK